MIAYSSKLIGRYDTGSYDQWSRDRSEPEPDRHSREPQGQGYDAGPVAFGRDLTGDEAFQRRLAMSAARARSPAAFASPAAGQAELQSPPPQVLPQPAAIATQMAVESGDEAYLRRLAMSSMRQPPPVLASAAAPPAVMFPPQQEFLQRQRSPSPPALTYNPFAPPSVPPPPPGPPGANVPNAFQEKAKAAAAIAARLGALAASAAASAAPPTSGTGSAPQVPVAMDEDPKYVLHNVVHLYYVILT